MRPNGPSCLERVLTWRGPARAVIVALASISIASCGGGGGDSGGSGGNSGTTPNVTQLRPSVSTDVDAAAGSRIRGLISTVGTSADFGSGVAIAVSTPTGETPVVAVDGDGNLLLAALVPTGSTSAALGAESTALLLIRIAAGKVDSPAAANDLNSAIRGAASFPQLTQAVRDAVGSGSSPIESADVLALLARTLADARGATSSNAVSRVRAQARVINPLAPTALPKEVIPDPLAGGVSIRTASGSAVRLRNDTLVPWAVTVVTDNGATPSNQLLPAGQELTFSVRGSSTGYNVLVEQDAETAALEMNAFVASTLEVVQMWAPLPLTGCSGGLNRVIQTTIAGKPPTLSSWLSDVRAISSSFEGCLGFGQLFGQAVSLALKLMKLVDVVGNVIDTRSWVDFIRSADYFWNVSGIAGVCLSPSSGAIVDCPVTFQFAESRVSAARGASFKPVIASILSASGSTVPVDPALPLRYQASGSVVEVDQVSGQTTIPSSAPLGTAADVRVEEPWSGGTGQFAVVVSHPTVTPSAATLRSNGTADRVTLSITNEDGGPIVMPTSGVSWAPLDPGQGFVELVESVAAAGKYQSTWKAKDNTPEGQVYINAIDPLTGEVLSQARINVTAQGNTKFKYTGSGLRSAGTNIDGVVSPPGPISIIVTLLNPVASSFSGLLPSSAIAKVEYDSSGVGPLVLTIPASSEWSQIRLTNGAVSAWSFSTLLQDTREPCQCRNSRLSPPVSGTIRLAIGSGKDLRFSGLDEGASRRCVAPTCQYMELGGIGVTPGSWEAVPETTP